MRAFAASKREEQERGVRWLKDASIFMGLWEMDHLSKLLLGEDERQRLWRLLFEVIEDYTKRVGEARVAPELDLQALRSFLKPFDFGQSVEPLEAVRRVAEGLWQYQVHTPHPRYFGLFNPAPTSASIAGDALVAAFNPQLAAWSHSPLAAEIEQHLVRAFGVRFGYEEAEVDGTFASGGAEANHTAMLTALVQAFPRYAASGARALEAQPVFYVTEQSHHSFVKAARLCGIGTDAVHEIPLDEDLKMDARSFSSQISKDTREGFLPFMVVATAGTTGGGIIDPIKEIARIAADAKLWLHVDAAWGGAAALVPELKTALEGIERADSITFDAHKWLSVPMGAGLYITRHKDILSKTFGTPTDYMPRDAAGLEVVDPYMHSMQWSRRFTGLKVFLSLTVAGWEGYAAAIRHQAAMGDTLRRELENTGWKVINKTPLPVVCFVDDEHERGRERSYLEAVAREVVRSGEAWISSTRLDAHTHVLRACITNYRTAHEDVLALVQTLGKARKAVTGNGKKP
ncbi:MAG TPA: aminotransferase class V-fold PLP-dependent enzyme [Pyrinomonadaceae bacterium]